jgi:predicted aconitase
MLKLSAYENDMLSGKYGRMTQIAMENICHYAKILDVDELCPVTMSTVFAGAHAYLKAAGRDEVKENFAVMNMAADEDVKLESFSPQCLTQT